MKADVGAGHVFEFWGQEYLGFREGVSQFEIEPHGAKIILVTDDAPIAAVGVDDCLCPTIEQTYDGGTMTGRFLKKGETIYIVSEGPVEAAYGCEVSKIDAKKGLYAAVQCGEAHDFGVRLIK